MRSTTRHVLAVLSAATMLTACQGAATNARMSAGVSPAAAGTRNGAAAAGARPYSAADVRFMQRMVAHHTQALAMTALVRTQSARSDVRILALRMELSQRDELALMRYWLENRGEPASGARGDDASMPGMLGGAQLDSLKRTSGPAFDALYLRYMIGHRVGALTMVAEQLRTPDPARQPETSRLLSDLDAERRAEIHRLRTLLAEVQK